jgi:osmoprotectant transport system permease protein
MDFSNKLTFDPSLMYTALVEGQLDLISAYTTDGRVAAFDLVLLEDPRNALLAYDAMLLASDAAASNPAFMRVVDSIIDSISDASMLTASRSTPPSNICVPECSLISIGAP